MQRITENQKTLYDGFIGLLKKGEFESVSDLPKLILDTDAFFDTVLKELRGQSNWGDVDSFLFTEFAFVWIKYKERVGCNVLSKPNFDSGKAWLRNAVSGTSLVLRGESALIYMQSYTPYRDPAKLYVYSTVVGNYDNMDYQVIKDLNEIDYIDDGVVKYASFAQVVNEMMLPVKKSAGGVLFEALSRYYAENGESFAGLEVWEQNKEKFVSISAQVATDFAEKY